MSDDGPKSAFELAMERLRQKDKEASIDDRPLTDEPQFWAQSRDGQEREAC